MFKIDGTTLHFNRGNVVTFGLSIKGYIFEADDRIKVNIYEKNKMNLDPVSETEIIVEEKTPTVKITIPKENTTIGRASTKPVEYWYSIVLNDAQTVIGYDSNGPKILMLYPEGV